MNNQIKYGALISYLSVFLNIIIGLVYTPWMIRSIGKADYGLYTLACSVIGIFVFDFGLGQAVTKFVARFIAENRQDKANQLIGITYKLYIIADFIVLVLLSTLFFFLSDIYSGLTPDELDRFKVVYGIAASFSVLSFPFIPLNGILSAYELFIQLKSCDIIHKLIIVLLMAICLLMGYGLYALVIVNAIAGIVIIILKLFFLKRKTPLRIEWKYWDNTMLKGILVFSLWITIAALAQRLVINICPSILGMVSNSQNIAIFGIAMTLEAYVYTFANAINGLFLPKVTQMVIGNDDNKILQLMIKVGRIQFFIMGLIIIGFICAGENFINVWLGNDFSPVFLCAIMMIAPSFISLAQHIGSTAIVVKDKVNLSAYISIAHAVLNISCAYPLAKMFGAYGVAFSIFLSYSLSLILTNLLYHKILGLNIIVFFKETLFKMLVPLVVSAAFGYALNIVLGYEGWFNLIVKVIAFGLLYVFLFYKLVFVEEERNLFLAPINKFLRKAK